MARRRRLESPDPAELAALAAGFAAKPAEPPSLSAPPIARVAAEAAGLAAAELVEARLRAAGAETDAARWRAAEAEGHAVRSLPLDAIDADHLPRDRMRLDEEGMVELIASIRAHGLRAPIEVTPLDSSEDRAGGERFGLISGWRRLAALRALLAETGDARFAAAPAFVRPAPDAAAAYVAMVEENEIRADLSHYERGRIAVIAARQGAFASTEAAIEALFASGSKAKRSKIRSFTLIVETLGESLRFGAELSEREGLRLAGAIRSGRCGALRAALARRGAETPEQEWAALAAEIEAAEADRGGALRAAVGRPRRLAETVERFVLTGGAFMEKVVGDRSYALRFRGGGMDQARFDVIAQEILRRFGQEG